MKSTLRLLVMSALALLISIPATYAQTPETSTLPVTEPLDVGGTILQPGTYAIRVLPSRADRNKVQVTSPDFKTVYATVLTVPHALAPNEEMPNTMFVYYPAGEGSVRALRTWFAPNPEASLGGHDIVYSATRAQQLARLTNTRVVTYQDTVTTADLDTADLTVVTPEATVEEYTYVSPTTPAPMISSETRTETTTETEMPNTASRIPLIALLGLASLAGAFAFRIARR
jgi:putative cell wall-binding protein